MLEADIGCSTCWRRGRRASELARGHGDRMLADVRGADSVELQQQRISDVRCAEKRERIIHCLSGMKRGWTEEIREELKCCQLFPLIIAGLYPADEGAQAVAMKMVSMWKVIEEKDEDLRQNRVTLDFMVPERRESLANHVVVLATTGRHNDELALAAKEYNMLPSHAQRVEELHAKLLKLEQRPGPPKPLSQ